LPRDLIFLSRVLDLCNDYVVKNSRDEDKNEENSPKMDDIGSVNDEG